MKIQEFVGNCIEEMISDGVSVEFTKRKLMGKTGYNYFYDGSIASFGRRKIFKIHFYRNSLQENYGIFIHEYCHYKQWKEKIDLWAPAVRANTSMDLWLNNKPNSFSKQDLVNIQLLELDCDKRAIDLIKQHDFPIDVKEYIKESNSYIWSYNLIYELKDFFICTHYADPDILKYSRDTHIDFHEVGDIPENLRQEYLNKYNNA